MGLVEMRRRSLEKRGVKVAMNGGMGREMREGKR
jgi:hypothetical protein